VRQVDRCVGETVTDPHRVGVARVRILGDLDLQSVSATRDRLMAMCTTGPVEAGLVVELGPDSFVDVRGLRMLIELSGLLQARGDALVVVSTSHSLTRAVQVLQLDGVLRVVPTMEEALREVLRRGC